MDARARRRYAANCGPPAVRTETGRGTPTETLQAQQAPLDTNTGTVTTSTGPNGAEGRPRTHSVNHPLPAPSRRRSPPALENASREPSCLQTANCKLVTHRCARLTSACRYSKMQSMSAQGRPALTGTPKRVSVPDKRTVHRKATTHYWSALHLGAVLLPALLASNAAVAGSLDVPIIATDWILTLDAPDTVYSGVDIVTRVSLRPNSSLPKYVYPWMSAGLRQNTTGEIDVDIQAENGTFVPKTMLMEVFIDWKHVVRRAFAAGDSMTTYVCVWRFGQRTNRGEGVLPPGVYQLTATCDLSESVPGERPRTVFLRSNTSFVVVASPPEQYAAAHAQLLLAVKRCGESRDRKLWSRRDVELKQLRSLASKCGGTRIGAWAATALVTEMMYDVGYGRSTDLGRLAREVGELLLANASDGLQVPMKAWVAYSFVRNRDPKLAETLLTWLASAAPGTRLAETMRRTVLQEATGTNGGLR
jgi:hypothetical protein